MSKLNSINDNKRLVYLDNCKIFLILLVIGYHSAHAYSNSSWIFKDSVNINWISNYLTINRAFLWACSFLYQDF